MQRISVTGGGMAGLVAAVTAAREGAPVTLYEAHGMTGGRARSSHGEFVADLGGHAVYNDGDMYKWLTDNDLLPPTTRGKSRYIQFRHRGVVRRTPLCRCPTRGGSCACARRTLLPIWPSSTGTRYRQRGCHPPRRRLALLPIPPRPRQPVSGGPLGTPATFPRRQPECRVPARRLAVTRRRPRVEGKTPRRGDRARDEHRRVGHPAASRHRPNGAPAGGANPGHIRHRSALRTVGARRRRLS